MKLPMISRGIGRKLGVFPSRSLVKKGCLSQLLIGPRQAIQGETKVTIQTLAKKLMRYAASPCLHLPWSPDSLHELKIKLCRTWSPPPIMSLKLTKFYRDKRKKMSRRCCRLWHWKQNTTYFQPSACWTWYCFVYQTERLWLDQTQKIVFHRFQARASHCGIS